MLAAEHIEHTVVHSWSTNSVPGCHPTSIARIRRVRRTVARVDTTEQKTLRALAAADGAPYWAAVLQRLDLTADAVKWALPRLEATAEVEKVDRKRLIVDPLFAEWVAILKDGSAIGRDRG